MKNPQTTIAPTFLTHIISAIGGVTEFISCYQTRSLQNVPLFSACRVGNFPTVVNQLLKNVKVH